MISKLNEFGKNILHMCQALPFVADFLWDDYSTVSDVEVKEAYVDKNIRLRML